MTCVQIPVEAQNVPSVHDGFDYAFLSPLDWHMGGEGWTGKWLRAVGDHVLVREGGIEYHGMITDGNRLSVDVENAGLRYDRSIQLISDTEGTVVWASALLDFRSGSNPNNVANITLTRNNNQEISFGRKYGAEIFTLAWDGAARYDSDIRTEGVHWLVIKVEFSGDNGDEKVRFWIDPDIGAEPDPEQADIRVPEDGGPALMMNFGIDGIQIKAEGNTPLYVDFDEVRLGSSFAEVNPFTSVSTSFIGAESDLIIYPNPATDRLYLVAGAVNGQRAQIELLSGSGQVILSETAPVLPDGTLEHQLDLQSIDVAPGPYFVQIKTGNGRLTSRVILQ